MKLHINKIHDTHSVRSQLLRIFLLAGMFPLLVIGIFSIASVRKQMLARYESLEKADGLRVASSLNDITTTIYSSSDTLLNSNQCLSLFAAESLDSGIEEQLTALERALQTYFENTAHSDLYQQSKPSKFRAYSLSAEFCPGRMAQNPGK